MTATGTIAGPMSLAVVIDATCSAPGPLACFPTSLLPLGSRPFIEHRIGTLARAGVTDIVVCSGPYREFLEAFLEQGLPWGVVVRVVDGSRLASYRESRNLFDASQLDGGPVPDGSKTLARAGGSNLLSARTIESTVDANRRLLEGRTPLVDEPALERARNVRVAATHVSVSRRATLIPPVIIGQDVVVNAGAIVGPYAVLTNEVVVAAHSRVRDSIICGGMGVETGATVSGAFAVGGVAIEQPLTGTQSPCLKGLVRLLPGRRFYGVALARSLMNSIG